MIFSGTGNTTNPHDDITHSKTGEDKLEDVSTRKNSTTSDSQDSSSSYVTLVPKDGDAHTHQLRYYRCDCPA